jgi:hypothetical protein
VSEALKKQRDRNEILARVNVDLLDAIDPESQGDLQLEDIQRVAGNAGLKAKAVEGDRVASWLRGLGGESVVEAAVALQASVQPLVDKIGGVDQVAVLLDLVKQAGGWDGLKEMVARANAASLLPGKRER